MLSISDYLNKKSAEAEKHTCVMIDRKEKIAEISQQLEKMIVFEYPEFNIGDHYYQVGSLSGGIMEDTVRDYEFLTYRAFKNKALAIMFSKKTEFLAKLLYLKSVLDSEYEPDFSNPDQPKYHIEFNHKSGSYMVFCSYVHETATVYFSSKEIAEQAAFWLNIYSIE